MVRRRNTRLRASRVGEKTVNQNLAADQTIETRTLEKGVASAPSVVTPPAIPFFPILNPNFI